jgi:hypothetical protein
VIGRARGSRAVVTDVDQDLARAILARIDVDSILGRRPVAERLNCVHQQIRDDLDET